MILTLALQRWLIKADIISPLRNLTLLWYRFDELLGLTATHLSLKGSLLTGNTISQPTCLFLCSRGLPVWLQTDPAGLPSPTNFLQEHNTHCRNRM